MEKPLSTGHANGTEPVAALPDAVPVALQIRVIAQFAEILSKPGAGERAINLPEALREVGVDERACARLLAAMMKDLLERRKPDGSEKLRADLVWEIVELLEASGSEGGAVAGSDLPVQLSFVHTVPRPERGTTDDDAENVSWD
jgi:hypothetical protein